ncbi:MAG: amidohydrolase family protein [Chitinophagaceae bacterium]
MNKSLLFCFMGVGLFISAIANGQASEKKLYAISNVTVIPMNKDVILQDQTVIIENGIIKTIANAKSILMEKGITVIDGKGKYLIPGLFDMHAHFFYEQGEHNNTCEMELKMMLANGLTTVRILAGHPAYLEARDRVRNGKWKGPELFIASPQLVGAWPWPPEFKIFEIVDTKAKAIVAVRQFKKEEYDEIKITFMVKADVYDAIISTAKEEGIRVTGHVGPLVKLPKALKTGQQIEHMDEFIDMLLPDSSYNHGQSVSDMNIWRKEAWATVPYLDETKIPALAQLVKDAGIYVSPTNFFFVSTFGETVTEDEAKQSRGYDYIPSVIKTERWENWNYYNKILPAAESRKKYVRLRKKMAYELWKAGVPLMAGSDSPEFFLVQGFSLHDELDMFVQSGLSNFAALQTATVNPAKYLRIDCRKGTIETGKEADLLLLDNNPLEDIHNTRSIIGVFRGKNWYDYKAVQQMLDDARSLGK